MTTIFRPLTTSLFLIVLWAWFSTGLSAQARPMRGQVTATETGAPLLGATIVLVTGKANSPVVAGNTLAVSDARGFFEIAAQQGDTLRVTYVHRSPSLVVINNATNFIEVAMAPPVFILVDPVEVTTTTKTPLAVTNLSSLELQRDDNTSLVAALNRVPGLYVHQGTRSTSRITLRGIGARSPYATTKIRAYYGDIPLTDGEGTTTLEDIDLNQIEGVEVVRGPVSGLYGSGLGGAILLQPSLRKGTGGQASFSYGAFGTYRSAVSLYHQGLNAQFSHIRSDGYRDNNQYDRYAGSLTGRWLADHGKTGIQLLALVTDVQSQIPSSVDCDTYRNNPTAAANNWAAAQGYEAYTKGVFGVSINRNYADNIQHHTTLFAHIFSQEEAAPFALMLSQHYALGVRSRLTGYGQVFRKDWNWELGTEIYQEWRRYSEYDYLYTQAQKVGAIAVDNRQRHASYNLFASASFYPHRKWKIAVGANGHVAQRQLTDFYTGDSLDVSGRYTPMPIFSPRLSIRYDWNAYVDLFFNFSHGFSIPTASELQLPDGGFNKAIRPEQGYNVELGAQAALFKLITLEVVGYHMRVQDLLVARRTAQDRYIGLNAGRTQHTGVEVDLSLEFRPSMGTFIHPFLQYSWSYHTFLDFEERGERFDGNRLTGVPPHVLTAGIDYRVALLKGNSTEQEAPWSVSGNLNARYTAGMPITDDNVVSSDAYFLLGLRLALHYLPFPGKRLRFQLFGGVDNLVNSSYAGMLLVNARSFGGNAPRYYYPGLPRQAYVGLQVDF